ncbi:hypothetical protein [Couchioplanes caeruleus]|uniref:Gram-positive cocci surface proteins LPxTG domain-containing protein n=2 Tax=Couchioplanes caeruleus TaxID=56438 RepID=A0A1K0GYS9_9ACTN|nr:hypothetical protein [Couchioplanes caeruleus]OJF14579.1 hypothetical protein BG844_09060 [Couchioplanes caeruleus subsp. caeruleus]ROP29673.1 hypothetical protein EDD30_2480 [Couchioplanes caeruleus]
MRPFVPAAFAMFTLALPAVLSPAPASAAAVFVEINPSTARAGDQVGIRASCDDNLAAAKVTAGPMGTVTVSPRHGFLTATVRVPAAADPGDYRIELRCPDGRTATTTLHVVAKVEPARGPATGAGGTAPGASAPMLIGGGAATIAAGILVGFVALRRRRVS